MQKLTTLLAVGFLLQGCSSIIRDRLYRPDPLTRTVVQWPGDAPRQVAAQTSDALSLKGSYWPPASDGRLIVFFHGNGGNHLTAAQLAAPLAAEGYGVLVASYRGYGDNPGSPSQRGLVNDGLAFLKLGRQLVPQAPIYLFGYSLGAGVALEIAANERVAGVVTLGAFTSVPALAPRITRPFIVDRFDNLRTITQVEEPLLLMHGTRDPIVPFAHAERLRAASAGRARLVPLEGADHHPDFSLLAPVIRANLD